MVARATPIVLSHFHFLRMRWWRRWWWWGGVGGGGVWAFATEVVTKSFTSTEEGLITLQESDYSLLLLQSNSCEKDSDPPSLFKCSYH